MERWEAKFLAVLVMVVMLNLTACFLRKEAPVIFLAVRVVVKMS